MDHFESFGVRVFTRRNVLLFLLSFFAVLGTGAGNRPALFAAEFLVILLVVQWLTVEGKMENIKVRRVHTPRTFEGDVVTVDLHISNTDPRPAFLFEAVDTFPPAGEYRITSMAAEIPAKSELPFRVKQKCTRRRGLYILGPVRLQFRDVLGIFNFAATNDCLSRLLVYPQAVTLKEFGVLGAGTHFDIGEEIVRRIGRSAEFERLRRYRPGDPPRLIHWPSTARLGEHYVKEFEQNVVTEVTIYCDLFLLALSGIGDLTSVEFRIKAAASIVTEVIRRHHLVKVVAVKSPLEETRLAGGTQHLISILDWMALLKPEGRGSFEQALTDSAQFLRKGATVILVMSTVHLDTDSLIIALRLLKMRNIRIIAVLVDDRSFLKLRQEQEEMFRSAPPLERLVAMLRNEGCTVYTLANQDDVTVRMAVPV